jgi:hypothetical protein
MTQVQAQIILQGGYIHSHRHDSESCMYEVELCEPQVDEANYEPHPELCVWNSLLSEINTRPCVLHGHADKAVSLKGPAAAGHNPKDTVLDVIIPMLKY